MCKSKGLSTQMFMETRYQIFSPTVILLGCGDTGRQEKQPSFNAWQMLDQIQLDRSDKLSNNKLSYILAIERVENQQFFKFWR